MRFCRIFFFKQTTAYEWRISDWSSDVCSSDLVAEVDRSSHRALPDDRLRHGAEAVELVMVSNGEVLPAPGRGAISMTSPSVAEPERFTRSEEHTSELQSLMRSSYAVFCLKTKTQESTSITIKDTPKTKTTNKT